MIPYLVTSYDNQIIKILTAHIYDASPFLFFPPFLRELCLRIKSCLKQIKSDEISQSLEDELWWENQNIILPVDTNTLEINLESKVGRETLKIKSNKESLNLKFHCHPPVKPYLLSKYSLPKPKSHLTMVPPSL